MMKLRVFRGKGAFDRARQVAGDNRVCGTYIGREPAYFLASVEASDDEIRATAFKIREGRDIGEAELVFAGALERHTRRAS